MGDGTRPAAWLWARHDVRRRWRSLVVLGVLAGITAGLAIAAFAGARRADTALDRFRRVTNAADALVFSSQVGAYHPDWDQLRARPDVDTVAVWDLLFGTQDGEPDALLFAANDATFGGTIGKPVVVSGRMWDPAAPDEIVVTPDVAKSVPIGSTTTFQPYAADQPEDALSPQGPTFTFRVVGVVKTVNAFLFTSEQVFVGPGFIAAHGRDIRFVENADVKLHSGAAGIPELQRVVNDVVAPGTPVLDLHAVSRRVSTTIDVEHAALLMLAVAIALAGGLLVAQALARSATLIGDDALVLRAIGFSRGAIGEAALVAHALTIAVAVVVAIATAVAASPLFPIGLSRDVDPDVGVHVDVTAIGAGLAVTAALLLAGTTLLARRAATTTDASQPRLSPVVGALRAHVPLTIGLGTSMALEAGAGRTRAAVRPALVGAVVGVLGVVGALTIRHAVDDAIAHPERAGVTWDAVVGRPPDAYANEGVDAALLTALKKAVPEGSAIASATRIVVPVDSVGVPAFSIQPDATTAARPIALTVTSGRGPDAAGEVALGPKTAHDLHAAVGDTVTLGDAGQPATVVGLALFPPEVHSEFDEGIWMTDSQLRAITRALDAASTDRVVVVRFPKGTDKPAAMAAIGATLGDQVAGVQPAEVPVELTNLDNVRTLPLLLAAFLGLLAVAAVSYVLVTSARRRSSDFAVLRAIGLSRWGSRLVLNTQGTTIAIVGVLIGVPLGIAVGRSAWRWVAERVPLEDVPPFAVIAMLLVIPATVLAVNAIALWPGRRVSRLRPAEVLRAE